MFFAFIKHSKFNIQHSLKFKIQNSEFNIILGSKFNIVLAVKQNIIKEKTFNFALDIIELYKDLTTQKEFIISKQILRSGTSIGANIEEASAAQTKKDFIAKMAIASKEARETKYWLTLLQKSQLVNKNFSDYLLNIEEIIKIITSIIKTSQENLKIKN